MHKKMIQEEKPMRLTSDEESSDSDEDQIESSENEHEEEEQDDEPNSDLPEKFDLSKISQRMEEGPPSSSDEDEEIEDDYKESSDDDNDNQVSGWADAMAKVLNMGKKSETENKPLLLSKVI